MLKVTQAARDRLLSKLVGKNAADDEAWRFTREKGGWRLRLDRVNPNDRTLAHRDRNVLLLDRDVLRRMTKLTLDVTDDEAKPRLTLRATTNGTR